MSLWLRKLLLRPVQGALLAWSAIGRRRSGVTVLVYHRVTGGAGEIDLEPGVFARQLAHLGSAGTVVTLEEALAALAAGRELEREQLVLTFDDGYADFHATVFPQLVRLGLPATVYVTTGFAEGSHSPRSGGLPPGVRPLTWAMLRELHASGLVTVGAHSHAHCDYAGLDERAVEDDIARSSEAFARHLGFVPRHFAYPRAKFDAVAEAVVRRRYASAAVGGGARAVPGAFDPLRLPRLPVRRSDGMFIFRAKARGLLGAEERFAGIARAALGG